MQWPRALLLLLAFLAPASAGDDLGCPLGDSGRLVRVARSWNLGGGVDSDGCAYGIDAKGRRRTLGLEVVAECPRCDGAFLTRPLTRGPLPRPGASSANEWVSRWTATARRCSAPASHRWETLGSA